MSWEHAGGEGRWQDYVNSDTGEHSIKEHHLRVVKTWCAPKDHNFIIDDFSQRLAHCSKCGQEISFVVGRDTVDGQKVFLG